MLSSARTWTCDHQRAPSWAMSAASRRVAEARASAIERIVKLYVSSNQELLRAAFEALRQGVNFVNAHRGVPHAVRSFDLLAVGIQGADTGGIQRLFAGAGECDTDHGTGRRN